MLRNPPHILVTTPESLYILLTAQKSREHLRRVHTVIVDEIHAIADDKRGSHLALSLERLDALVTSENSLMVGASLLKYPPPLRIGLSATQNPIELVAQFLGGHRGDEVQIVQAGQRRKLDVAIEVPTDELGSVATMAIWRKRLLAPGRVDARTPLDAGLRQHALPRGASGFRWVNASARKMSPAIRQCLAQTAPQRRTPSEERRNSRAHRHRLA